jgi:glutaconate CoA-transferase, subunit A
MQVTSLSDAIRAHVHDGQTLALEGFTHLIPFAAAHEIIRQGRRDLHLVRMTPDLVYDQMIGMGCASALTFSWGGNPGVGSLHRLRDAVERGWPGSLVLHEHSHAGLAAAYTAGAARLPFAALRAYIGNDLPGVNGEIRAITCPYTGERLAAVPAVNPDVTILHAQQADRAGNVLLRGIVGAQKEAALAARKLIVTVEERVEKLDAQMNAVVLPYWVVSAIAVVPAGAYPSYAQGYYERDNAFYLAWDDIARDRDGFLAWMRRHVLQTRDHAEFLRSLPVPEGAEAEA